MVSKGNATKERILETAEAIILRQGYGSTSIDDILKRAHITKGGGFYHFKGKNELAVELMERYRRNDHEFFMSLVDRAKSLVEDPLQQMLLFLKLMAEEMASLPDVHPGCLVATFTYESEQCNDEVKDINKEVMLEWRAVFRMLLEEIDQQHAKAFEVDNDSLADALTGVIEGGIVVSKALADQQALPKQILHYRDYIRLLYQSA